jgi:hypothetical protein
LESSEIQTRSFSDEEDQAQRREDHRGRQQVEAGRAVKESPGPSSLSSYGNGSAATSASHPTRRFAIETNLILYAAGARVLLFRSGS